MILSINEWKDKLLFSTPEEAARMIICEMIAGNVIEYNIDQLGSALQGWYEAQVESDIVTKQGV